MESEKESVKDLIVDVSESEVKIALMDNHRLIELNKESSNGHSFTVGDVFLGKVKKVMPALNAAFVDIGDEKEAFIHYLDLGFYFNAFDEFVRKTNSNTNANELFSNIGLGPVLEKEGQIEKILKPGQMIVVQIVKEPISTKGSRLTAEISLAGRNIVLLPFAKKVSISQKIAPKEELLKEFPQEEVKEYGDATLLPGLMDMHAHLAYGYSQPDSFNYGAQLIMLYALQHAQAAFERGITTVRDMSSAHGVCKNLKLAEKKGFIVIPRIVHTDTGICMTGGHAWDEVEEADGPWAIRTEIRKHVPDGAE